MATTFSSLPIVDLSILSEPSPPSHSLQDLSRKLSDVFSTTGFAYLTNTPLGFSHNQVFALASDFFRLDRAEKLSVAKRTFVGGNTNDYRGYFPTQPDQLDNLKEGFEIGSVQAPRQRALVGRHQQQFNLTEPNVWPDEYAFSAGKEQLETLHQELQLLSTTLLSLLAVALGKSQDYFASYLTDSLSTLRLLHYPPQPATSQTTTATGPKLCCTPHTDSGLLTLLHQDPSGGLEVLNAEGQWVAAPYVPGSIVVNIGDLMAHVSGGRFVATMHRVRASTGSCGRADGMGRFSVPFFFEPGEECVVRSVDGGERVVYGEYVRRKMDTWVEYQDVPESRADAGAHSGVVLEVC
ncbi:hypothetical protein B0A55_07357 [Friedmanniomyces simplex]|uniref:Fe2OG dioxygenase domain-containing protein n=1 Tax=Friedmanniomyces simplex TaxID=329884 RepID=A0A4U0X847_9PEZI|nr:hypothetical protein B0A55_07357 [Friedmanniomyces simplex]